MFAHLHNSCNSNVSLIHARVYAQLKHYMIFPRANFLVFRPLSNAGSSISVKLNIL